MKRIVAIIFSLVFAVSAMFGTYSKTQTIVLVSIVEESQPEFAIRDMETGKIGNVVVHRSKDISEMDVTASFQIIQTNNSNFRGVVTFDLQATEMYAYRYGYTYCTDGVSIMMNGMSFGNEAVVNMVYDHNLGAGNSIASFMVKWPTDPGLVDATYEAAILLNYTVS